MPAPRPPRLNLNGYTEIPAGKIAAVVTYLEMRARPRLKRLPASGFKVERLAADFSRYRALFRAVGERWLWFSRLALPDERLEDILTHPDVESFALVDGARDIGLLELDFRRDGACEIAYFGLVPEAIGRGAGRFLMHAAIRRAFRRPIGRLFLHTCSLDHPAALDFYRRSGFVPYRRAIEVADDPRLTGALPARAGPHMPLIGTQGTRAGRTSARARAAPARARTGRGKSQGAR